VHGNMWAEQNQKHGETKRDRENSTIVDELTDDNAEKNERLKEKISTDN